MAVVAEGVARDDVGDVLALDEHVGLADGVGLVVKFLAVQGQAGLGVVRQQVFARDGEHAARARRGVVEGAHHGIAGREHVVVLDEQQVDHEADDFARGEVLPGGFVRDFGELADQFLEDQAHAGVVHRARVQVDVGEFLGHQVEQVGLGQALDLGVEVEALEDVARRGRERLDVGVEVLADVILVAQQAGQIQLGRVVEALPGLAQQEMLVPRHVLLGGVFGQHGGLGTFQHAVQAAQNREGQDDAAVFGLLVVAAQQVGHRPDEG